MKTILIGLVKHYKPTKINPTSIEYEVDCFGEKEYITVGWTIADPKKHEFQLLEPLRTESSVYSIGGVTYPALDGLHKRVCYIITYKGIEYNIPTTLEESDYLNLLITQLFANQQNEQLQIIKSVIENEVQKIENLKQNE